MNQKQMMETKEKNGSSLFSIPLVLDPNAAKVPIEQITKEKKSELLSEFADATGVAEKKKRGRSSKAPVMSEDEKRKQEMTLRGIYVLVSMATDWASPRMPTPIETTETEKRFICEPLEEIVKEFWPEISTQWKYVALAGGVGLWAYPRMKGNKKDAGKEKGSGVNLRKNGEGENVPSEATITPLQKERSS